MTLTCVPGTSTYRYIAARLRRQVQDMDVLQYLRPGHGWPGRSLVGVTGAIIIGDDRGDQRQK